MISEKTILDLQKILFEEFGQKLDFSEVSKMASELVRFVETLIDINKTKP